MKKRYQLAKVFGAVILGMASAAGIGFAVEQADHFEAQKKLTLNQMSDRGQLVILQHCLHSNNNRHLQNVGACFLSSDEQQEALNAAKKHAVVLGLGWLVVFAGAGLLGWRGYQGLKTVMGELSP